MKKLKGVLLVTKHLLIAWIGSIKKVWTNRNVYFTFNQTFFYGIGGKENRDLFQSEYGKLVEKYNR